MSAASVPPVDPDRYVTAGPLARAFNRLVGRLVGMGLDVQGSWVLGVVGRTSGVLRENPVNLLEVDGAAYLVAPRGQAHWVRNLRAAEGRGSLRRGRRQREFVATEVADADKGPILQAYLARWWWEVGAFFEGLDRHATVEDLAAVAPGFPVFRLTIED